MARRVVITGMGVLSPLGRGVECNWQNLVAQKSAISVVPYFDTTHYACQIAGVIPYGQAEGQFNPDTVLPLKDQRRIDPFILFGITAGTDAMEMARFTPKDAAESARCGIVFGSGVGGLWGISNGAVLLESQEPRRLSPFIIPSVLINLIGGHLSIKYQFKGPQIALATACATGTHCIGEAYRYIKDDLADVMLAGGAEAAIAPVGLGGFAQARALSTHYNATPEVASRPFDKGRDGFVMGEGAGALVLEEYEHARARGATIYAELVGYALTSDAYHITAPGGDGALRCMQMALQSAHLKPEQIDYINTHGTSTVIGDPLELQAIKTLFGTKPFISSTKGNTGHLLGAAGAVEAVYSILMMNNGLIPATANLTDPVDEADKLRLVMGQAQETDLSFVLSNSFGFGGANGTLIFKKVRDNA